MFMMKFEGEYVVEMLLLLSSENVIIMSAYKNAEDV